MGFACVRLQFCSLGTALLLQFVFGWHFELRNWLSSLQSRKNALQLKVLDYMGATCCPLKRNKSDSDSIRHMHSIHVVHKQQY